MMLAKPEDDRGGFPGRWHWRRRSCVVGRDDGPAWGGHRRAARRKAPSSSRIEGADGRPRGRDGGPAPTAQPAKGVRVFYSTRDDGHRSAAHVGAETTADDRGRFSLDLPPVDGAWPGMIGHGDALGPPAVVARRSIPVYRGRSAAGAGDSRPWSARRAGALFEVHDPDGQAGRGGQDRAPVAGSSRDICRAGSPGGPHRGRHGHRRPRPRRHGRLLPRKRSGRFEVIAAGYGRAGRSASASAELTPDPKIVQLRPVGRLKGRLVGETEAIRRCPLSVSGFASPDDPVRYSYIQDVTTDDDGQLRHPRDCRRPSWRQYHSGCRIPLVWPVSRGTGGGQAGSNDRGRDSLEASGPGARHRAARRGTMKPIVGVRIDVALAETVGMTSRPDGRLRGISCRRRISAHGCLGLSRRIMPVPIYGHAPSS